MSYYDLRQGFAQGSQVSQVGAASMPDQDPTPSGSGIFRVPLALCKCLSLIDGNAPDGYDADGYVGLNANPPWNQDFGSPPGPDQYDAVGILKHEISECLGRIGLLNRYGNNVFGPMDLYRWSVPGQRELTWQSVGGWFSVDGSDIEMEFNGSDEGGDVADWSRSTGFNDAFGDGALGQPMYFTQVDVKVMRALGYVCDMDFPPIMNA